VLRVEHLTVPGAGGRPLVDDVSLQVRAGEIVGIAGVAGNGQLELLEAIAGLRPARSGSVRVGGTRLDGLPAGRRRQAGVAYVPEDRHARGFVPTLGVRENLVLSILERLSRYGIVRTGRAATAAGLLAERLQIVASGPEQPVAELSGGNQQKVVVGRALASHPSLLVVVSPTVGVDVASKEALLAVVDEARRDGAAVLLVSDDLDELRICTRVLVVRRGRIVREFRRPPWDRQTLIATAEGFEAAA
jgi:simple sugar transport system ATP-binding protein